MAATDETILEAQTGGKLGRRRDENQFLFVAYGGTLPRLCFSSLLATSTDSPIAFTNKRPEA